MIKGVLSAGVLVLRIHDYQSWEFIFLPTTSETQLKVFLPLRSYYYLIKVKSQVYRLFRKKCNYPMGLPFYLISFVSSPLILCPVLALEINPPVPFTTEELKDYFVYKPSFSIMASQRNGKFPCYLLITALASVFVCGSIDRMK